MDECALGFLLGGDLLNDGGDGLYYAVGVADGGVVYVPVAVFAWAGGEYAFDELVADGMAGELACWRRSSTPSSRGDLGDAAADDLIDRQAEGLGLAFVDAEVAELGGIEESQADGAGLVDAFELGALALGLEGLLLELFGVGLAVVNVDGDAEPVEDFSGVVADGEGAEPPPADSFIAGANHTGFDLVLGTSGDGVGPCLDDAGMLVGVEGVEPADADKGAASW